MFKEKFFYCIALPTLLVCAFLLRSDRVVYTDVQTPQQKKKIVIFTSSGGGGHMAATQALQSYLQDEYIIIPYFPLIENDPVKTVFFGYGDGEDMYNYLVMRKYYNVINFMARGSIWYYSRYHDMVTHDFMEYLEKVSPDLVISVIPFINKALLHATKAKKIPFLLMPTDLDMRTFINNIGDPNYEKFHLAMSFENDDIKQQVAKAHIPRNQTSVCGFPLREDFFAPKDIAEIKQRYTIPEEKPVILVLMGASGSYASYRYVKQLTQVESPLHVIVVLGRNELLRPKIEELELPDTMSLTILGFTPEIADLMAVSDLCITKSGSVSFCEALYSNLPMLLDGTTGVLRWERFNHKYTEAHNLGYIVKRYSTVPRLITQLLNNPKIVADIRNNLKTLSKKQLRMEIKPLIEQLLVPAPINA
jgi:processive 1,2-diacylglycerol beta-glucosyltransferase